MQGFPTPGRPPPPGVHHAGAGIRSIIAQKGFSVSPRRVSPWIWSHTSPSTTTCRSLPQRSNWHHAHLSTGTSCYVPTVGYPDGHRRGRIFLWSMPAPRPATSIRWRASRLFQPTMCCIVPGGMAWPSTGPRTCHTSRDADPSYALALPPDVVRAERFAPQICSSHCRTWRRRRSPERCACDARTTVCTRLSADDGAEYRVVDDHRADA